MGENIPFMTSEEIGAFNQLSKFPTEAELLNYINDAIAGPPKHPTWSEKKLIYGSMIALLEGRCSKDAISIIGKCGYLLKDPRKPTKTLFKFVKSGDSLLKGLDQCCIDFWKRTATKQDSLLDELYGIILQNKVSNEDETKLNFLSYLACMTLRCLSSEVDGAESGFFSAVSTFQGFYQCSFEKKLFFPSYKFFKILASLSLNNPDVKRLFCSLLNFYRGKSSDINHKLKAVIDYLCLFHTMGTGLQLYIMFCWCVQICQRCPQEILALYTTEGTKSSAKIILYILTNYVAKHYSDLWQWSKIIRPACFGDCSLKMHPRLTLLMAGTISCVQPDVISVFHAADSAVKTIYINYGKAVYNFARFGQGRGKITKK